MPHSGSHLIPPSGQAWSPCFHGFCLPQSPHNPLLYHHSSYSVSLNLTPSSLASLPTISEAGDRSAPNLKCGVIISLLENYCEIPRPGIQKVAHGRCSIFKIFLLHIFLSPSVKCLRGCKMCSPRTPVVLSKYLWRHTTLHQGYRKKILNQSSYSFLICRITLV